MKEVVKGNSVCCCFKISRFSLGVSFSLVKVCEESCSIFYNSNNSLFVEIFDLLLYDLYTEILLK
ncbi:hypothetical protein FF38_11956 [Lucilia cuprina]|uniref:Uncharacterized protein n=1 Tax=Lucilia cuprina TaxID=7375 RepID=A0A0L0CEB6_LUCCU|nr:hypothetical protein FF38_11956 [Lucilia cuprina]